jgi:hypothetical protein
MDCKGAHFEKEIILWGVRPMKVNTESESKPIKTYVAYWKSRSF